MHMSNCPYHHSNPKWRSQGDTLKSLIMTSKLPLTIRALSQVKSFYLKLGQKELPHFIRTPHLLTICRLISISVCSVWVWWFTHCLLTPACTNFIAFTRSLIFTLKFWSIIGTQAVDHAKINTAKFYVAKIDFILASTVTIFFIPHTCRSTKAHSDSSRENIQAKCWWQGNI